MDHHTFNNNHADRDCVDCGKPASDPIHKQKIERKESAAEPAEAADNKKKW